MIVTDLYQDRADIGRIFQAIKSTVFPLKRSVGIVAVRSGFRGVIYDIGPRGLSQTWVSGGDAARYRPFYILVIGTRGNVAHYLDELFKRSHHTSPSHAILISPDVTSSLMEWNKTRRVETTGEVFHRRTYLP